MPPCPKAISDVTVWQWLLILKIFNNTLYGIHTNKCVDLLFGTLGLFF
jgi:hypothetical protein